MNKSQPRKEGKMKGLRGETVPKNLLFLDTETYVMRTDSGGIYFPFRLGYAINLKITKDCQIKKRDTLEAYSIDEMVNFIIDCSSKKETLHVFAHNVPFDIRVMFAVTRLEKLGYVSEPPIINQMVFIWELRNEDRKIIFYDTANFGVRSVESLGSDMGYEKMTINFRTCTDDELMTYCIRDVEILEKFMYQYISFIYRNKLGSFKMTLASQSLAAFRTRFLRDDMYIHNHNGALQLERDAYSGGRTEAFKLGYIGQQNYYYMDVNSMYPTAMTKFKLPSRICGYEHDMSKTDFAKVMYHFYVIADVTIATNSNAYAFKLSNKEKDYNYLKNPNSLYYPDANTRRLIFPVGRFRVTLHHEELRLALKEKSIVKIHRVAWYERSNPFDDYINFFSDAKIRYSREGNKTWRMIAKLFLNSLYGKFGQLAPHREELPTSLGYSYNRFPIYMEKVDLYGQIVSWQGRSFLEYKEGETAFSNPAIAGAITANARMILYNYIQEAGKDNVFYVDTDSLILNEEGYRNLQIYENDNEMGYLGLERVGRRLIVRNCKDYRLDSAYRFKGLPKSAVKVSTNLWRYDKFQGFITWLNNQALDGAIGRSMTKSRKSSYNKGIVLPDNRIIPYVLSE